MPELQLLTAQGAGAAPPGLQPVHLAKSGHNVLGTSDSQFTGNKRDLFPVKHPSLPRIHNRAVGAAAVGDTPPHFGFPPLEESEGQAAPTVAWGLVELLCLVLEGSWGLGCCGRWI